jgi:hypothetical protein
MIVLLRPLHFCARRKLGKLNAKESCSGFWMRFFSVWAADACETNILGYFAILSHGGVTRYFRHASGGGSITQRLEGR